MINNAPTSGELYVVLVSATVFFVFLSGFIIYFIILYQKKQLQNKAEREVLEANFKQEFLKARLEIQEETFTYVGRELHDNINQVLSFVKLNLAMIKVEESAQQTKINENRDLVAQVITDLRDLSKSLSFEHITKLGLVKTIENEVDKLNKSGLVDAELIITGDIYPMGEQRELVLFRIFQEAVNNTIKHSGASHLKISLQYIPEMFNLTIEDDGVGFSANSLDHSRGSGLMNIENRATVIGAVASISSSRGDGCSVNVNLNPLLQIKYIDGKYPNRLS
ncbi:sensor histidine kinase [Mucilaginibacter flavidus]|uniref:sensor histidine kinase n=1 Tax=Mucilaginibacter flavidus TaxID=2949309 RepID=UPI0020932851|nr:ATP-binding protein [Mucilaginibacter flavidus]MCO5950965.1 histidine kinase [Mucilaginibacter flavidus]